MHRFKAALSFYTKLHRIICKIPHATLGFENIQKTQEISQKFLLTPINNSLAVDGTQYSVFLKSSTPTKIPKFNTSTNRGGKSRAPSTKVVTKSPTALRNRKIGINPSKPSKVKKHLSRMSCDAECTRLRKFIEERLKKYPSAPKQYPKGCPKVNEASSPVHGSSNVLNDGINLQSVEGKQFKDLKYIADEIKPNVLIVSKDPAKNPKDSTAKGCHPEDSKSIAVSNIMPIGNNGPKTTINPKATASVDQKNEPNALLANIPKDIVKENCKLLGNISVHPNNQGTCDASKCTDESSCSANEKSLKKSASLDDEGPSKPLKTPDCSKGFYRAGNTSGNSKSKPTTSSSNIPCSAGSTSATKSPCSAGSTSVTKSPCSAGSTSVTKSSCSTNATSPTKSPCSSSQTSATSTPCSANSNTVAKSPCSATSISPTKSKCSNAPNSNQSSDFCSSYAKNTSEDSAQHNSANSKSCSSTAKSPCAKKSESNCSNTCKEKAHQKNDEHSKICEKVMHQPCSNKTGSSKCSTSTASNCNKPPKNKYTENSKTPGSPCGPAVNTKVVSDDKCLKISTSAANGGPTHSSSKPTGAKSSSCTRNSSNSKSQGCSRTTVNPNTITNPCQKSENPIADKASVCTKIFGDKCKPATKSDNSFIQSGNDKEQVCKIVCAAPLDKPKPSNNNNNSCMSKCGPAKSVNQITKAKNSCGAGATSKSTVKCDELPSSPSCNASNLNKNSSLPNLCGSSPLEYEGRQFGSAMTSDCL